MVGKQKFPLTHRILHWVSSLAMTVLLITGFLHMYWMAKHHMADLITKGMTQSQITIEQAIHIAKSIRAPMWEWHIYFAYVMVFAFVARIIYILAKGNRFPHPFRKTTSARQRFEGITYLLFYILVGISIITGFYHLWGTNPEWRGFASRVHIWAIYWFPAFIVIHFVGFIIAERSRRKGIVSKMIGGD